MKLFYISFFIFFYTSAVHSQQYTPLIDSLIVELNNSPEKEKTELYGKIIWELRKIDPARGLEFAKPAMKLAEKYNDKPALSDIYNSVGSTYRTMGDYKNSLDYFFKSLELGRELDDSSKIARSFNNIGALYMKLNIYDKALDYFLKSQSIKTKNNNTKGLANTNMNIGLIYRKKGNYDKAVEYQLKALSYADSTSDDALKAKIYNNLGVILLKQNNSVEAKNYFMEALKIKEKLNDDESLAVAFNNLSNILFKEELYDGSIGYAEESLLLSEKISNLPQQALSYKYLARNYAELKDFEKAYDYSVIYAKIRDSIYKSELTDQVISKEVAFVVSDKDKEISQLADDIQNLSRTYVLLIISIVVLAIIGIILLIRNYYKQKVAEEFKRLNEELNIMNSQLKASEEQLRELNYTKDKFFSVLAHDLKNPLGAFTGMTEILINSEGRVDDNKTMVKDLDKQAKNIYNLLENLLEWSRIQTHTIKINPIEADLNFIVKNNLESLRLIAGQKGITIENRITNPIYAFIDVNMITTVLRNLISNAIKFSYPDSTIDILLIETQDQIKLIIEDHGIGIPGEKLKTLFTIEGAYSSSGTLNEKGSGLGLLLCKEFVELNKGEIQVVSHPDKGSSFIIVLPKISKKELSSTSEKSITG